MKIVVTGGGSGGHITPILAVAHELKKQQPDTEIVYIGQKGDALGDVPAADKNIDQVALVRAGKFRRYHSESFLQHLRDIPTVLKNIRDAVWTVVGLWQSFQLLRQLRPDIVFIKGGFVGVPVGLAAALLRIPYVTHDSDAMPGLANRIIARWAHLHAVALPKEVYRYPADKTVTVGVPVSHEYRPLSAAQQQAARKHLGLDGFDQVVLVTGGGLGAKNINEAIITCMPELLARYPKLAVVHVAGRGKDSAARQRYKKELSARDQKRVIVRDFATNLYQYSGAADVVVARAGGTAIAELAAQAKACIVVPNPLLAGGHQLKNARVLADRKAVRLVDETVLAQDHQALMPALTELLDHPDKAAALGKKLAQLAQPDAARHLAMVLLDTAKNASVS
jgi:UDP-N-acetylglucosamine--N-acetylmuramyl-(pentapeptide) pyrophosphoryl-undecaprenol N-acetylglucosamine transferase